MSWFLSRFLRRSTSSALRPSARLRLEPLEDRSVPAVFVVTSTNDAGAGTLRAAIAAAEANPDADTIVFSPALTSATINLTTFDTGLDTDEFGPSAFVIRTPISIAGSGQLIQRSGAASNFRLFTVTTSGSLTLDELTLDNGRAIGFAGGLADGGGGGGSAGMGGAIFNRGTLTLTNSLLSNNIAQGGNGGNTLQLVGGSTARGGGGGGGGVGAAGGIATNTRFNGDGGGPNGGVGFSNANRDGVAGGFGGGASGGEGGLAGATPISGAGGAGGFGGGGGGGGISSVGTGNAGGAGGFGGGGGGGGLTAAGGPGGFGGGDGIGGNGSNVGGEGGGGGAGMGGAVFSVGGSLTILNTTFSANTATGQLGASGGGAGAGLGGAVFVVDGDVSITHATFSGNTANSLGAAASSGGALYLRAQGADVNATLRNNIFANSTSGTDVDGTETGNGNTLNITGGTNLIENGVAAFTGVTSLNVDPQLGTLASNAGLTQTFALSATSPALNAGAVTTALADQRGAQRGGMGSNAGNAPDLGAYEATSSYLVTTTADDVRIGSLRAAINFTNSTDVTSSNPVAPSAIEQIRFNLPNTTGVNTIRVGLEPNTGQGGFGILPAVTSAVNINGHTQPGGSPNNAGPSLPSTAVMRVELDGTNAGAASTGIALLDHTGSTVRGLVINRFVGAIFSQNGGSHTIAGNYLGVDPTGTSTFTGQQLGVRFVNSASGLNLVGGVIPADRNVISGFSEHAVISQSAFFELSVAGNYIGTNAAGTASLGNGRGITVEDPGGVSTSVSIGGPGDAANVISGTTVGDAISITLTQPGSPVIIQGNRIGTNAAGTAVLGNFRDGIRIQVASIASALIGATDITRGNIIAGSGGNGITVLGSGFPIMGNSIYQSTGIGIDRGNDGVTPNDLGDADGIQNFPVLTSTSATSVSYTLNSQANRTFRIEFFANDENGREGRTFLGTEDVVTDGSGNVTDAFTFSAVAGQPYITATATLVDTQDNFEVETSEFSAPVSQPTVSLSGTGSVVEGASRILTLTRTGDVSATLNATLTRTLGTDATTADFALTATGGSVTDNGDGTYTVTFAASSDTVSLNFAATDDIQAEADETFGFTLQPVSGYTLGTTTATVTITRNDFVVINTNDAGEGSLRQAVLNANFFTTADTITFVGVVNPIVLNTGQLILTDSATTTIQGGTGVTVSGGGTQRVFRVASGASAVLDRLTVTDGNSASVAEPGGGIANLGTLTFSNGSITNNAAPELGGGFFNSGTMTITNSTISGNSTDAESTAETGGGAGYNSRSLSVLNSTVFDNSTGGNGGGFYSDSGGFYGNGSGLTLVNSTISGNTADGAGGGISAVSATIVNSTITGNSATNGGGMSASSLTLRNSIVANSTGGDLRIIGTATGSNNLIEDGTGVGTNFTSSLSGDPNLGALANNGGPTQTHALLGGSIALDAGSNALAVDANSNPLAFDQRGTGFPRIFGGTVDIGAFEVQTPTVSVSVSAANVVEGDSVTLTFTRTSSDGPLTLDALLSLGTDASLADFSISGGTLVGNTLSVNFADGVGSVDVTFNAIDDIQAEANEAFTFTLQAPSGYTLGANSVAVVTITQNDFIVINTNDAGEGSLRQAVLNANFFSTADTITFQGVFNPIILSTGEMVLDDTATTTIQGTGITVNANNTSRVFRVAVEAEAVFVGLTIFNGDADNESQFDDEGGGIYNGGTLTLNGVTLQNNNAGTTFFAYGGGVYNAGTLTMTGGSFIANDAEREGGGLYNFGEATLTNVLFDGNTARDGAAISNAEIPGDPDPLGATLTIIGSRIINNIAIDDGGGIVNYTFATLTIDTTTIANNRANGTEDDGGGWGGGIVNGGDLIVTNSTISGNTVETGGGIFTIGGTVTLVNTTISGNTATGGEGGGIWVSENQFGAPSMVLLTNVTITGSTGTGLFVTEDFGAVPTVVVNNTIVANTVSGGDFVNINGDVSGSNNLIEDGSGVGSEFTNSMMGDPSLGTLTDNGGPTLTHALLGGSNAINAGSNALAVDANNDPLTLDQRGTGFDRIVGGTVDIGAFEVQTPTVSVGVSAANVVEGNSVTLTFTRTSSDGPLTLDALLSLGTDASLADFSITGATLVGNTLSVNFADGEDTVDVTFNAIDDIQAEANEAFTFTLQAPNGYILGASSAATVTITRNDFVVINTNNAGEGSLRQAILNANFFAGLNVITFVIPGAGVQTISPSSPLPNISEAVTINGFSQSGASANTLAVGNNATMRIVLSGVNAGTGADGLRLIDHTGSTIRGLVINRFDSNGILIQGGGQHLIAGNFIGTNDTGTAAAPNGNVNVPFIGEGVRVDASNSNQIGTSAVGDRNLLSGNFSDGVDLRNEASGNIVVNNYIGTNAAGTAAIPNLEDGLYIEGAIDNIIGGTTAAERNVISGNQLNGVFLYGAGSDGNTIQGNYIGVAANGTSPLGNGTAGVPFLGEGVFIWQDSESNQVGPQGNTIGGTVPGSGNVIAFNGDTGITIDLDTAENSQGNAILGNSIFGNAGLGIDLGSDGVTANDPQDPDTGPNNLQNFPVITAVTATTITATLNSLPFSEFRVEFFAIDSNVRQGRTFLGFVNVTTDASGNTGPFSLTFTPVTGQSFITATATRLASQSRGNIGPFSQFDQFIETSEFSAPVQSNVASVTQVAIDDGTNKAEGRVIAGGQHSKIKRITVTLDRQLTGVANGARFTMTAGVSRSIGGLNVNFRRLTGAAFVYTLSYFNNSNGTSRLVLQFSGGGLTNGNYRLEVGSSVTQFHRLLGDFNGDRVTNTTDFNIFRPRITSTRNSPTLYVPGDFNDDGLIDWRDLAIMRGAIGGVQPPPTT